MAWSLGTCTQLGCDAPAVATVGVKTRSGEQRFGLCQIHYAEATMPCAVDGCLLLGEHDIALSRRLSDGTERIEQVRICAEHWQRLRNAVPLSIDGVYLVSDGHGRLEPMPDRTRRG